MKGVLQTTPTNCLQACLASILEIPIKDIPDFSDREWLKELNDWLFPRGFYVLDFHFDDPDDHRLLQGYQLGAIPSNNHPGKMHCVVCRNGHIVWDPLTGEKEGEEIAADYDIFIALDASRMYVLSESLPIEGNPPMGTNRPYLTGCIKEDR